MDSEFVKIVVFSPIDFADKIREALGSAGAGGIANYTYCTFSSRGTGRFLPQEGAHPAIGEVGKMETVEEERIETVCERKFLKQALAAVKAAHPYEAPAIDVYPVEMI